MSLKEFVAHEVETLEENELKSVAEYVSFLKFRARASIDETRLSAIYSEFEREDRELAEEDIEAYVRTLSQTEVEIGVLYTLGIR